MLIWPHVSDAYVKNEYTMMSLSKTHLFHTTLHESACLPRWWCPCPVVMVSKVAGLLALRTLRLSTVMIGETEWWVSTLSCRLWQKWMNVSSLLMIFRFFDIADILWHVLPAELLEETGSWDVSLENWQPPRFGEADIAKAPWLFMVAT